MSRVHALELSGCFMSLLLSGLAVRLESFGGLIIFVICVNRACFGISCVPKQAEMACRPRLSGACCRGSSKNVSWRRHSSGRLLRFLGIITLWCFPLVCLCKMPHAVASVAEAQGSSPVSVVRVADEQVNDSEAMGLADSSYVSMQARRWARRRRAGLSLIPGEPSTKQSVRRTRSRSRKYLLDILPLFLVLAFYVAHRYYAPAGITPLNDVDSLRGILGLSAPQSQADPTVEQHLDATESEELESVLRRLLSQHGFLSTDDEDEGDDEATAAADAGAEQRPVLPPLYVPPRLPTYEHSVNLPTYEEAMATGGSTFV